MFATTRRRDRAIEEVQVSSSLLFDMHFTRSQQIGALVLLVLLFALALYRKC
jgi:hypothetical protein